MSSSAARAASASILQAPSSSEYSLWTCRWTASALTRRSFREPQTDSQQKARDSRYGRRNLLCHEAEGTAHVAVHPIGGLAGEVCCPTVFRDVKHNDPVVAVDEPHKLVAHRCLRLHRANHPHRI